VAEGPQPRLSDAPTPAARTRRGVLLALAATGLWSTTGIFIDPLVSRYHATPVQISFWRALLVTAALALTRLKVESRKSKERHLFLRPSTFDYRLSRREALYYVAYGLVGIALFNVVWSASVAVNKAAVATALIYSAPMFVALGGRLLYHERISPAQGAAILINLSGCALVSGVYDGAALFRHPMGLILGLGSGVAFAAYTLFGKGAARLGRRDTTTVLSYTFGVAALGLLAWGLLTEGPALLAPRLDVAGWVLLLGLSFGPTLLGYALFTASLAHISSTVASLLTTLEPPITAVLALLLLGRVLSPPQWLGMALIVAGVLLIQAGPPTRHRCVSSVVGRDPLADRARHR